ncbi:MAG: hydrogenase 3 maturation endopeptidase HyCI [Candidatus Diapherotrites archaeon]|nr:hydrogenase 3 maturation endopeptidase HyCI [Candidatus Diapherotrites archaeon]
MKTIVMGIGSPLHGDDAVGNAVAEELKRGEKKDFISIACETVPENFAGVIEREKPAVLVIVDAAEMGLPPGSVRLLRKENLDSATIGTHGVPLQQLVLRLEKYAGRIICIGVQPGEMLLGEKMSPAVMLAKKKAIEAIERAAFSAIPPL